MCITEACDYLRDYLQQFFIVTNDPYEDATDFRMDHQDLVGVTAGNGYRNRLSKRVHSLTKDAALQQFPNLLVQEHHVAKTNLRVDLWGQDSRIAYEIALGNGQEFWKDVTKALLLDASNLIILARKYPNRYNRGYEDMSRWANEALTTLLETLGVNMDVHVVDILG